MDKEENKIESDEKKVAKKAAQKVKLDPKAKKEVGKLSYGVDYLAKALDKEANLVRVQLRNANIKKLGKSYGWATKAEADAIVKQLKSK